MAFDNSSLFLYLSVLMLCQDAALRHASRRRYDLIIIICIPSFQISASAFVVVCFVVVVVVVAVVVVVVVVAVFTVINLYCRLS